MICILPVDPHPTLEPGIAVEVIRGPLAGLRGVLIRKGPRTRLLVAIRLLGQGASVDIAAADGEREVQFLNTPCMTPRKTTQ